MQPKLAWQAPLLIHLLPRAKTPLPALPDLGIRTHGWASPPTALASESGCVEWGPWPPAVCATSAVTVCLLAQGLPLETYLVAYKYGAVVLFNVGNEEKEKQILKLCMPHISDPPRRGTTITDGAIRQPPCRGPDGVHVRQPSQEQL